MVDIVSKPVESYMESKWCFYEKGQTHVFDVATLRENGQRLSHFSNKSIMELQAEKPNMAIMLWTDAEAEMEKINESRFSGVEEITEDEYNNALNVLPPLDWNDGSFLVREPITGSWFNCYLKYNGKYYSGYSNRAKENSYQRRDRFIKEIS